MKTTSVLLAQVSRYILRAPARPLVAAFAQRAGPQPSVSLFTIHQIRSYHTSLPLLAKGKKGGKGAKGSDDGDEEPPALPDMKALGNKMDEKISRMADELSHIRGGRVSIDMFHDLEVNAFGSTISLDDAGQAVLATPTKMVITTYDANLATPVADAIRGCGLSLNPTTDGNKVTIVMPKPSAEVRESLAKAAGKTAEKFKQDVRQTRKDGMDAVKKIKAKISEDASRRFTKELDTLTEKKIDIISKMLKDKEKELKSSD